LLVICVDPPVAEVAYEQIATEGAEVRRRERQSPRRIEGALGGDARHEVPAGVEHVDEPAPGPGDVVHSGVVLPRVRDEDRADDADFGGEVECRGPRAGAIADHEPATAVEEDAGGDPGTVTTRGRTAPVPS